jgi:hypothetical protein
MNGAIRWIDQQYKNRITKRFVQRRIAPNPLPDVIPVQFEIWSGERGVKTADTKADAKRFWALRPTDVSINIELWSGGCSTHNCMF